MPCFVWLRSVHPGNKSLAGIHSQLRPHWDHTPQRGGFLDRIPGFLLVLKESLGVMVLSGVRVCVYLCRGLCTMTLLKNIINFREKMFCLHKKNLTLDVFDILDYMKRLIVF